MPAQPKHRAAIVAAAAGLFRRNGYAATGLNDIVARSKAPKGSLYHYFPRGKAQIGEAAVLAAGALVRDTLERLAVEQPDAAALVREYVRWLGIWMAQSGWRDGCPITTVLLETAAEDEIIRAAGREAFAGWVEVLTRRLEADGVAPERAKSLAGVAVSALEGSLIQARVERSEAPIAAVGEMLAELFAAARYPLGGRA
ncbi:TetR/AcrR family transcriptional regulator [Caulobacter mirabilis]|uniref:TetR family transcriptional regulator n=1 Tax=Caulobacter mirabilis TaxID=69666 RepID=A0A2D2AWW9_9CAUL|nr:TetR/AcrR family transcriptional regulator [Caulobacter mirabilis]ATQ42493.1 TetR family transcriptional regulator [Caulobacter mirabilis]